MYEYAVVKILKVIDGDTVKCLVDLGFRLTIALDIRLAGINAPEMKGAEHQPGIAARDFLAAQLLTASSVAIKTTQDKYGRWLGTFTAAGVDVNQLMIQSGHAVAWDGEGPRPGLVVGQ